MKWLKLSFRAFLSLAVISSLVCNALFISTPKAAAAAVQSGNVPSFTTGAKVSFTFDDGLASAVEQAAPVLAKYGYSGTSYVVTDCIGMVTVPNECAANTEAPHMTWGQLAQLKNTFGWEIASHSKSHPLATDGLLSAQQLAGELGDSQQALQSNGYTADDFATPYGDYDNNTLAQIAKTYASHRAFADTGYNAFPYNDYLLEVQQVQGNVSVEEVKSYIDRAAEDNEWLILVFHDIKADTDPGYNAAESAYEYKAGELDQIAAYAKSKGIAATNISDGLAKGKTNLFANGNFNNGIADGWTTDTPESIKADSNDNGSYDGTAQGPVYSMHLTGAAKNTHLFSPLVNVNPEESYVFKNYVNFVSTTGEIAFLVDEYDANDIWIGSQYYDGVVGGDDAEDILVNNVNFVYVPGSTNVAKVRLQVIAHGSGTEAYFDNSQMFPVSELTGAVTEPEPATDDTPPGQGGTGMLSTSTTAGQQESAVSQTAVNSVPTAVATAAVAGDSTTLAANGVVKSAQTIADATGRTKDTVNKPATLAADTDTKKTGNVWIWAVLASASGMLFVALRSRKLPRQP